MQKSSLLIVFIVSLLTSACWKKNDPNPDGSISNMAVSAKKNNDEVTLGISAYTFKSPVGPEPTTFDEAEVWISEEASGYSNMKLAYTTKQKTLKLENLKPDKTYYVAVKGTKNGKKTEFSKAIMFITSSLKPISALVETTRNYYMKGSANSPYLAYVDEQTGEVVLKNWQDKSTRVLFKNIQSKWYQVKGFYAQGSRLFLETGKNNNSERAFEYYDIAAQKFVPIEIPANARVWNYSFSPDGSKLAYTDYSRQGLYIYDITNKVDKLFSNDSFFYSFNWSADGKHIFALRNKVYSGPTIKEIVKYDVSNASQVPTSVFEWPDETIAWVTFSPKEDYVLFGSYVANSADLWICELKSKKLWQISDIGNFGWVSDKEFFVNGNKAENEVTYKTYKYTMP
ncbi:WD40 repeat domain-containing protein [Emticicia sp. C21]|uniref:TolB family protein n=1 Tax=Emticicia sp. C21 TaxID=2302915 RepID=UPI000E34845C|nr:WD40 repeat domain-containing protein [Emticicia sp. C21]RFS16198.1 WD40 repeat domain-containing protein [Emticicia sp. C21]